MDVVHVHTARARGARIELVCRTERGVVSKHHHQLREVGLENRAELSTNRSLTHIDTIH